MDSTASPKVKTLKKEAVGVPSLARNISRVERHVGAPRWGSKRLTSNLITHTNLHKPNNKLVSVWLEHFGALISHGQTQTHKTHHGLELGEATTFTLIIYSMHGHETNTQMSFCPMTPKWESQNSQNCNSRNFGGP